MTGLAPLAVGSSADVGGGDFIFLGQVWGVAVVFWGACAVLVALAAMLRSFSSDSPDQLGRLHTRIRRFRFTSSKRPQVQSG